MTPPRLARRLLERTLPEDAREHIVEDLGEVYRRRVETGGRTRAQLWYWREALSFSARFGREGMRAGLRAPSWVDAKLGARILMKHPGVTLVSVLGMAASIALAASWWEFSHTLYDPDLPIEAADRVVRVENRDLETGQPERRSLHDFELWRREVRSIEGLSAAARAELLVRTGDGRSESVGGVRLSPSAFGLLRVEPLLGRLITEEDATPGAPLVVLLGYDLWQRLFEGDGSIVGREIRVGRSPATVVGVMPEGFGFPTNQELWLPFGERAVDHARREGPVIVVFGRLAEGLTAEEAQAELTALGLRMAGDFPDTHETLRPRVGPLIEPGVEAVFAGVANLIFVLLLLVVCACVGTLVFARTVMRQGEIALRTALGASRGRILLQLFTEALVLTMLSALTGLAVAAWGYGRAMEIFFRVQEMRPPFWFDGGLSATTVLYVLLLATLAAAVIGVLPALKATGRHLRGQIGGAATQLRFGVISTGMIVLQVALCVALIPLAVLQGRALLPDREASDRFPATAVLSGRLSVVSDAVAGAPTDRERAALVSRMGAGIDEVQQRLRAEPEITAVAFADRLPGMNHPVERILLEDSVVTTDSVSAYVRTLAVDVGFFDALNARVVAGRTFQAADVGSAVPVLVVGRRFAEEVLGGATAVGRRLRYPARAGDAAERWHEVVGVVEDPDMVTYGAGEYVGLYRPLSPEGQAAVEVLLRTTAPPSRTATRVREIVTAADPDLVVDDVRTLAEVWEPVWQGVRFGLMALGSVCLLVLVLSLSGVYALMSFTVAQRTREIAIRAALGADPRRIIAAIFSRALLQIGIGVLVGATLTLVAARGAEDGIRTVAGVAGLMLLVGFAACAIPARRALRIEPAEVLRGE